ncbi:MAG: hypothetical protein JXA20_06930 [Spirochaetes bacterium]|nr:hypothetical protein [Spirochaetota bacterium]
MGLIHSDSFLSLPIYFGCYMMYFDTRGDIAPYYPLNDRTPFIRISGSGPAAGPYLGMAISFRLFGSVIISLFGIVNFELSDETIHGTVVADNPSGPYGSIGTREGIALIWSYYISAGLRISLRGESPVSMSLVITSFAPEMNPFYGSMHEGLRMRTYGLTVSYNAF